jgi:hypothetical protein
MAGLPTLGVYQAALLDYLMRNDESGLMNAYEIGRSGLDAGCGLLQMLHVHERALGIILDSTPTDHDIRRRVDASTRFLNEALSPFELAWSGFREMLKAR